MSELSKLQQECDKRRADYSRALREYENAEDYKIVAARKLEDAIYAVEQELKK